MPHQIPNPHDAEVALRPALGALHENTQQCNAYVDRGEWPPYELTKADRDLAIAALKQALDLLGVPHV